MNAFDAIFSATPELIVALEQHRDKTLRLPKEPAILDGDLVQRWLAVPGVAETQRVLTDFNIFVALNATDYETRHSRFLAWLFNPEASHGLGPSFLAAFLQMVVAKGEATPAHRLLRLHLTKKEAFATAEILSEHKGADLLIVDRNAGFVCLVENKIHTGEHSNQLTRYRAMVAKDFPGLKHLYVFLTLKAETPSDPAYVPLTYAELCSALNGQKHAQPANQAELIDLLFQQYIDFIDGNATVGRPNIFTILRLREIKHSDFLAWLFTPMANHGLGLAPLSEFLRLVQLKNPALVIPALTEGDWDDLEITRETYNIDLLIVSERHRFVCLIENKLEAREGNYQLQRYKAYVRRWYPGFQTALIFLTLRGDQPTDPEYVSLRFADFTPWLRSRLMAKSARHWGDVAIVDTLLEHYRVLLRERLSLRLKTVIQLAPGMNARCKKLWQQEPTLVPALLSGVRQRRLAIKADMEKFTGELITSHFGHCFRPDFYPGRFRDYLPFVPAEIDQISPLRQGGCCASTGDRLFDFLVLNRPFEDYALTGEPVGITIIATLRPAASGYQRLRNALNTLAQGDRALFNKAAQEDIDSVGNYRIMSQTLATADDFLRFDLYTAKARLQTRFERFAHGPFADILKVLRHPTVLKYRPN